MRKLVGKIVTAVAALTMVAAADNIPGRMQPTDDETTMATPLSINGSTAGFSPADVKIAPEEITSTTLTGFDMQKLYAWQGKISYNPLVLKLLDVTPGTLLPEPSIFFA